ncbi:MAG: hypothetical protein ACREX8_11585, partial [Gammaproteobacteria bacterium]
CSGGMHTYSFRIIARSKTNTPMGVGVVVTVSVLAGSDGHKAFCGTLTMTEPEWTTMAKVLASGLGDAAHFEDQTPPRP